MAVEIERTFLVNVEELPPLSDLGQWTEIEQAYLSEEPCVRIRTLRQETKTAVCTVKGPGLLERSEFEWSIPVKDAETILGEGLWLHALNKRRYRFGRWEIDEFLGSNSGLWLAEIELERKQERFDLPEWLGKEVTEDPRYTNLALARDGVPE